MGERWKILWSSDWHVRSKFKYSPEEEWWRLAKSLEWLIAAIARETPDIVITGGDLVDNARTVDFKAYSLITKFREQLNDLGEPRHIVLCGNHDMAQVGYNAIDPIVFTDRITETKLYIPYKNTALRIGLVPYMKEPPEKMPWDEPVHICFAHVGMKELLDGQFGKFEFDHFNADYVVSGHYHIPTTCCQNNVLYPGALLPRHFVDAGDHPFGAHVFNLNVGPMKDIWDEDEFTRYWPRWQLHHRVLENPQAGRFIKTTNPSTAELKKWAKRPEVCLSIETEDPEKLSKQLAKTRAWAGKIVPVRDAVESPQDVDIQVGDMASAIGEYVRSQTSEHCEELTELGVQFYGTAAEASTARQPWSLKKLRIIDFLSVKDESLTFGNRVSVISGENLDEGGSNGAGKSTLIEALYWCLYGRRLRGLESVDEVIRHDEDWCYVRANFHNGATEMTVRRYRKNPKRGTGVSVHLGEKDVSFPTVDATNEEIVRLIGIDRDQFRSTVLFSRRSAFASEETAGGRAEGFLRFLGVGLEGALKAARTERGQARAVKERLVKEQLQWDGKRQGRLEELVSQISQLDESLKVQDQEETLGKLLQENTEAAETILEAMPELPGDNLVAALKTKRTGFLDRLVRIRGEDKAAEAEYHHASKMNKHTEQFLSGDISQCPTCRTRLTASRADRIIRESRAELNAAEARLDAAHAAACAKATKFQRLLKGVEQRLAAATKARTDHAHSIQRLKDLKREKKQLRKQLRSVEKDREERKAQLRALHKTRMSLKRATWEHEQELADARHREKLCKFWAKGFARNGLPSYLLIRMLEYANERLELYLDLLVGGKIRAQFEAMPRGVNFHIQRGGVDMTYVGLSDGQQSCVNLATQFALHDVQRLSVGGISLLVFDEAISHIDGVRARAVVDLIRAKSEAIDCVLFITHREDILEDFLESFGTRHAITARYSDGVTEYVHGRS